jgi:hypothetical protein
MWKTLARQGFEGAGENNFAGDPIWHLPLRQFFSYQLIKKG